MDAFITLVAVLALGGPVVVIVLVLFAMAMQNKESEEFRRLRNVLWAAAIVSLLSFLSHFALPIF